MSNPLGTQERSQAHPWLLRDLLDLVENDLQNVERTMRWVSEDCIWELEPGGTEYWGTQEIRAFMEVARSLGSLHRRRARIVITNWFAGGENVCIEYSRASRSAGEPARGPGPARRPGLLRHCVTCHLREGKINRVHEFIGSGSWWRNALLPVRLSHIHWRVLRKLARKRD